MHISGVAFQCDKCLKMFSTKSNLRRHKIKHKNDPPTKETLDEIKTTRSENFNNSRAVNPFPGTDRDMLIDDGVTKPLETNLHTVEVQCHTLLPEKARNKRVTKDIPDKTKTTSQRKQKRKVRYDQTENHNNQNKSSEEHLPFTCFICSFSYDSRLECVHHMADKHSPDWLELKQRNNIEDINKFSMRLDKMVDNIPKMIIEKNSGLKFISSTAMRMDAAKLVTAVTHNQIEIELNSSTNSKDKMYFCALCPKSYFWKPDLRRHMDLHAGKFYTIRIFHGREVRIEKSFRELLFGITRFRH